MSHLAPDENALSDINELLAKLQQARTGFEIFKCFRRVLGTFGFDWFAVVRLPEHEDEAFRNRVILTNWDPELIEAASEPGLTMKYPISERLRSATTPQVYALCELTAQMGDEPLQKLLFKQGHLCSVFLPLHKPGGLVGYVSFSGKESNIGTNKLMALSYICAYAQEPLERITGAVKTEHNPLNDREMQVLQRLAHGETLNHISSQLGISVNTVNYHLRKAISTLGASTKIQAVGCAAKKGWIA